MLRKRLEVEDLTSADVERLITQAVNEAVGPLQQAVQELRTQMHTHPNVITHKEASVYFNYDVQPETILRYIDDSSLHQGGRPAGNAAGSVVFY